MQERQPQDFGTLLRRLRVEARLSQEQLAERAHISVQAVGAYERGCRRAPHRDTLALLVEALNVSGPAYDELAAAADQARRRGPTVAPIAPQKMGTLDRSTVFDAEAVRPISGFIGRENELDALDSALAGEGSIALLQGLGGVGKSSIAREYAWRNREHYSVIWRLNAESEEGIIEGFLRLGAILMPGLTQLADRRAAAQQVVVSALRGLPRPVLLIFDNLDDEALLRTWRPRTDSRMIVTSRGAASDAAITSIAVQPWSLETAVSYLERESGRGDLTQTDARAIAQALGALPLAVAHAAASLRGMRMLTPARYLERIGIHLRNAPRGAEYPRSVFATFTEAIAQAEQQTPGAAAVLCFAALFAPDAIPEELFWQPIECYPPLKPTSSCADLRFAMADDVRLEQALGTLDRLSLLRFAEESRTYCIHHLVQLAGQGLVGEAGLAWRQCAVGVASCAFPSVEFATWGQCERLIVHALRMLGDVPGNTESPAIATLAHQCAIYLEQRGEYGIAEFLCTRALAIRQKILRPDDPQVAQSLKGIGTVYYHQGRYAEAEQLYRRALAIFERAFGPDHPDVAKSLNGIAIVYNVQGHYAEAEAVHKRALLILEKTLGLDHPHVAISLSNLANVYDRQARYAEAAPLHNRALAIREKIFGPEHPDVALSLNNLAILYEHQGRYAEAERLYQRALAIREKALGPDHPDVAHPLNNLATLYDRQGRYADAEPICVRALTIRERALGPDHPLVAETLSNLAALYNHQRRYMEAESLSRRALTIREKVFGPDHPDVADTLTDLAALYSDQGRYSEAAPLCDRALTIRKRALGPEHPYTVKTRETLLEIGNKAKRSLL